MKIASATDLGGLWA